MKKVYFYIGIFVVLIGALFIIESLIPKPIDWTPTFKETHKTPWGTFVLHSELSNFFPSSGIEGVSMTAYEKLQATGMCKNTTYIFIDKSSDLDIESIEKLLDFVEDGNKVFISASEMPYFLTDTLDVYLKYNYRYDILDDTLPKLMYFSNHNLNTKYEFNLGFTYSHFAKYDTITTQALGFQKYDNKEYINYIKVKYGDGSFYLHTQPYTFTNYHLLNNNHADYVSDVFSYLDNENIFWNSKKSEGLDDHESVLRFILTEPTLRFAWRLGLSGILLFVLFMVRRRQRIVPIIKKLPNTSEEFAKTIGNLYYHEGETKDIVTKKITFFLEKIRSTYLLDTSVLDKNFKKRLHQKSGVEKKEIDRLINYISFINRKDKVDELFLVTLNKLIDNFNHKTL